MNKYEIIDDTYDWVDRQHIYNYFIRHTLYGIGWVDREDTINHQYVHANLSLRDCEIIGLLKRIKSPRLLEKIRFRDPVKTVVNLSHPCYTFFPHAHEGAESLVYYANLMWEPHWAGETMIYEQERKDIHLAIPFVPGRVLWLDKDVPHSLAPPSQLAPTHRITMSMFFE